MVEPLPGGVLMLCLSVDRVHEAVYRRRYSLGGCALAVLAAAASSTPLSAQSLTPYLGAPVSVPGTIQAANYDSGGEGVAYHDTSPGNIGGAYRQDDVDIEPSSEGSYDVGWIASGEWLNYTVNVANAGSYTAQIRVASPSGGGSLHIGFNTASNVWIQVPIPSTGAWQNWTTVNVPMTLGAGVQQMTLMFDTDGFNVELVTVTSQAPPSTGTLRMVTWNIDQGFNSDAQTTYTLPDQVALMASLNADVIVLQEVATWNEDQSSRIPALLQQDTGQTWYSVWAPGTGCATGGCLGGLLLSRLPIVDSTTSFLGPSHVGRILVNVGGVPINIITNHLEAYDLDLRTTELNELMSFASNFDGPRLVGGDFNSWWGEWWISQMETQYHDSWMDLIGAQDGGYTTGNVRFDYIFRSFDNDWHATPTNITVPQTQDLSDHNPVVVDFNIQ